MQDHKTHLLNKTDELIMPGTLNRELINFYAEIFDFQFKTCSAWKGFSPHPGIKTGTGNKKKPGTIPLDKAARDFLTESFKTICSITGRYNPGMNLVPVIDAMTSEPSTVEAVANALLNRNTVLLNLMAEKSHTGFDEYIFIIINWLKPLFISMREHHKQSGQEEHHANSCPFCGYYPDICLITADKQKKRYLHCILCENMWPYRNNSCAVCGTEDRKLLEYFTGESRRYRIDVCHKCRSYLKTVMLDESEIAENCDLTVENLLTLKYDAEFLGKGFHKL